MPKKIPIDDDLLRAAVASSTSFHMVACKVGNNPAGIYRSMRRRITQLGLDTTHFTSFPRRGVTWTDEQLRDADAGATSVAAAIRALGLVPAGGNYDQVQRRIRELGLDTSHMTGKAWNVGGLFKPAKERPIEAVLVARQWTASHKLKLRLFVSA